MRLNQDDFWESEATGLQVTVFPPYATILRWRGKGKFRETSSAASNKFVGLVLTEAQTEDGKEILLDENKIIGDNAVLDAYLANVYSNRKEFEASLFDKRNPVIKEQQSYLKKVPIEQLRQLVALFERANEMRNDTDFAQGETFKEFYRTVYDLDLIFDFNWPEWHKGRKDLHDAKFDFSNSTLLDISMYLTVIFRSERYSDGAIASAFHDGMLAKIFTRLKEIVG